MLPLLTKGDFADVVNNSEMEDILGHPGRPDTTTKEEAGMSGKRCDKEGSGQKGEGCGPGGKGSLSKRRKARQ